ncbi:GNAT family N-acetyltransferase [Sutcliffiella horikoshii]|uniref:GNAT family N-acetyltransferase n=1 Tax=Sutcliffiella horikoshii TaxID=79883 RepID=A0A5D4T463_9BACI|nr:GNAT family N-acetyltransferase [Sutcliffiella horikoshii]TYS70490.1 GNAT family N-acetyltransferase [Sutcliffiella horikoshii]
MQSTVKMMRSEAEIMSTFSIFKQLRPHLNEEDFLRLKKNNGFHLVAVVVGDKIKSAAGYRITESLAWGKYFYVEDLITDETSRGKGYASILWDYLITQAKLEGCAQFHLDSGVNRHDAHRFYLKGGLDISCHHFQVSL